MHCTPHPPCDMFYSVPIGCSSDADWCLHSAAMPHSRLQVLVFGKALNETERAATEAYLQAKWGLPAPACPTPVPPLPPAMVVGTAIATPGAPPRELYFVTTAGDPPTVTPQEAFEAAVQRADRLGRKVVTSTPDSHFNVGVSVAGASIDGLFRAHPPVFLHGAMVRQLRHRFLTILRAFLSCMPPHTPCVLCS